MDMERVSKPAFSVIGKEGSTWEGEGFIQRLWAEANSHFQEVAHLAKRDENSDMVGVWGLMTAFDRTFAPWENDFTQGLYLAGVECDMDTQPPEGWVKWTAPGFEYLQVAADGENVFADTLACIREKGLTLAGAVQDFTYPKTGRNFMLFPIGRL